MRNGYWIASLAVAAFTAAGCEDADYQSYNEAPRSETTGHLHDSDHDQGVVGKHGGHILELDDAHAHHAELVFDARTRDVTVYFYGAEVGDKKPASKVMLGLHVSGGHKEIGAKPIPLEGETVESSSCWVFSGVDLPENVNGEEQLDGHLEATIDGKQFSYGLEPHSHAHDEHNAVGESAHGEHGDADHKSDEHGDAGPSDKDHANKEVKQKE